MSITCCIKTCPGNENLFAFPTDVKFRKRWQEVVRIANGFGNDWQASGKELICELHFVDANESEYQEPSIFINGRGKKVLLASCRLCHRFGLESQMFSLKGQFAGMSFDTVILNTLGIAIDPNDFLQLICRPCLVKLDMVRALRNQFLLKESHYRCLEQVKKQMNQTTEEIVEEFILGDADEYKVHNEIDEFEEKPQIKWEVDETESEKEEPLPPLPKKEYDSIRSKAKKKPKQERISTINARTCYICSIKVRFDDSDGLISHLAKDHAGQVEYSCEQCSDRKFPWVLMYNRHLGLHDASERPFQCGHCTLRYCSKNTVLKHEYDAHGVGVKPPKPKPDRRNVNFRQQCEQCGKIFNTAKEAKYHQLSKHERGYGAKCHICQKTFERQKYLMEHVLIHTGELPYQCNICEQHFRTAGDRNKHIQGVHEGKKPYKCNKCQLSFKLKNEATQHRNIVHRTQCWRKRRYHCRLCADETSNAVELQDHIGMYHSNDDYPYAVCNICSQNFLTDAERRVHHRHEHDGTYQKDFSCDQCETTFPKKTSLQVHMVRRHGAEKKHCCELCGKRYILRGSVSKHKKLTHRDPTDPTKYRFECDFCDETFAMKSDMVDHWRKTHT
ncbi:zinc finger protein 271-like [Malaya genurostris]|uniref:zinc finger protein 271-like n=1 Tax=Malaya genurostris TaxID=325434 RepID=UPI0026F3BA14|nr:zinc finger protein 271-like [Malaya genurostris]XP_058445435.1 zinc finger protein 271-like [Malaya genurostris]